MSKVLPANWPQEIEYYSSVSYVNKKTPKKSVINGVRIIKLGDEHILKGEFGLIATKKWKKFNIVGEYTGILSLDDKDTKYMAYLSKIDNDDLGIDAKNCGNEMRFINDYRNLRDRPNVRLEIVYIDKKPKVLVVVLEDIDEDEELLLDYGEGYWNANK